MRKKNQINFEKNFIHGTESSNVTESSEVEADYKDEPHFKADFVLVYKELKGDKISLEDSMNDTEFSRKKKRLIFLENLVRYGLDIKRIHTNHSNTYVLIKTPFKILLDVAEKLEIKLPIEENNLEVDTIYSSCMSNILCEKFNEKTEQHQRNFFTAPYSSNFHTKFEIFFDPDDIEKTFLPKDRIALTYEILSRTSYSELSNNPFENFEISTDSLKGIERLLNDGSFEDGFPLHDSYDPKATKYGQQNDREFLWEFWAHPKRILNQQPIHVIRRYFGEKVGFYFGWLGFYTQCLIIPAIIGVLVFLYGLIQVNYDIPTNDVCNKNGIGNLTMCPSCDYEWCSTTKLYEQCSETKMSFIIDNYASVLFSVFTTIWSVFVIDFWKRKQSYLQFEWDTFDFNSSFENVRPQFEQVVKKRKLNKITGLIEPHISWRQKILKYIVSWSVLLLMICLVIIFLVGIIMYRIAVISVLHGTSFSSIVASITAASINLIFILILDRIYEKVAIKLTEIEHHKTETLFENALTIKIYMFQFVNFYSSIVYITYFKGQKISNSKLLNESCEPNSCLNEVFIQMIVIMVGKQILNNFKEIIIPLFLNYLNKSKTSISGNSKLWENDYNLISWTNLTLFNEYLELVIQFGFITLFVIAFSLGPVFALINNIIEIRIDAFKLTTQYKRPLSKRAQDIGIWISILNFVAKFGVITNGFMIAFTSEFVPRITYELLHGNNTLIGYKEHSLSVKNLNNNDTNPNLCWYYGYRESYEPHALKIEYYHILVAKLAFVLIFEHFVFFIVTIMHLLIPNVPTSVRNNKDREYFLTHKLLWDVNSTKINKKENILKGNI